FPKNIHQPDELAARLPGLLKETSLSILPDNDNHSKPEASTSRTLIERLTGHFAEEQSVAPLNYILRHVTREYLETLDPATPPSSSKVEQQLLGYVNLIINA